MRYPESSLRAQEEDFYIKAERSFWENSLLRERREVPQDDHMGLTNNGQRLSEGEDRQGTAPEEKGPKGPATIDVPAGLEQDPFTK